MNTEKTETTSRINKLIENIAKQDFRVFLACSIIAILLWLFNALNEDRTETINYPVEFKYDKKKYVALQDFPETISFNITASGWQVMWKKIGIGNKTIKYKLKHPIDLSKSEIPSAHLRRDIMRVLEHAKLGDIMTETIPVIMDRRVLKKLELTVDSTKIRLPKGYRIISPVKLSPKSVILDGSENQIRALENPFELELPKVKANKQVSIDVPIIFKKFRKPAIKKSTEKIEVSFDMAKFITKTISIPINKINFPKKSKYYLDKSKRFAQVRYTFREEDRGKIRLKQFKLEADFEDLNRDNLSIALKLKRFPKYILEDEIKFPEKIQLSRLVK